MPASDAPDQRICVKLWNTLARFKPWRGSVALSAEQLTDKACRLAGHDDFGDSRLREPLQVFIRSLNDTGRLHPFGRFYVSQMVVGLLVNRLKLQKLWRARPEILRTPISKPVVILGLPRTGTSLLVKLLAQDPAHRVLTNWETTLSPLPPRNPCRMSADPRRSRAKWLLKFQSHLAPRLSAIHDFHLDGPEECTTLLMQEFTALAMAVMFNVPAYSQWLNDASHAAAYRHHKRVLQTLQWTYPGERWLLKAPGHVAALDELLAVYPDACIVQTHRDPTKAVSSCAALGNVFRGICANPVNAAETGRQTLERLAIDLNRFLRRRRELDARRFFDVQYRDLVRDPLNEARRLYAHFGLPLTAETEERMRSFLVNDRKERKERGGHQYAPEDFGLTAEGIRERFKDYSAAYDLAPKEGEKAKAGDGVRREAAAVEVAEVAMGKEISRVG